jgi:hypothetical protein
VDLLVGRVAIVELILLVGVALAATKTALNIM